MLSWRERFEPGQPYFGPETFGVQGMPVTRHPGMSATIFKLGREFPTRRLQILEIGVFAGFSTLTWAQSLEEFAPAGGDILCVDPWQAYIDDDPAVPTTVPEILAMRDPAHMQAVHELFLHNIGTARSSKVGIDFRRSTSREVLPGLQRDHFDLVYVDGSHQYEDVLYDLAAGRDLVREGGVLCGDDLEAQWSEVDEEMAMANRDRHAIFDRKSQREYHVGVTLAVEKVLGPVSNYGGYFAMQRRAGQFVRYNLRGGQIIMPRHFPPKQRDELLERMGAKPAK